MSKISKGTQGPESRPCSSDMTIQSVSKLDAATRQLQMAIVLYFQDADALGVHTLAGAAHAILRDLLVRRDGPSSVRARDERVQPDHHAFVTRMVNKARNFLKHANRDPNRILRFCPDWTDFLLYEAIRMYITLACKLEHASIIFLIWLSSKYPDVLLLDKFLGDDIAKLRSIFPMLGNAKKRTFLEALNKPGSECRQW
jgi:hypothetical protein